MSQHRIVIVGSGFAGVWAALGASASRRRARAQETVQITLVSPDGWLVIRPRLYESDLRGVRVPLAGVLEPVGVEERRGTVTAIDTARHRLTLAGGAQQELAYDQLVLCAGSRVQLPDSLRTVHAVDSYDQAVALRAAVSATGDGPAGPLTAAVVGGGFTGIELACELADDLRRRAVAAGGDPAATEVHLIERADVVAPDFGPSAREHIARALESQGIRIHCACAAADADADGVTLDDGRRIAANMVAWAGGPRASKLYEQLGAGVDGTGRVAVDAHMASPVDGVWAAGDGVRVAVDGENDAVMSCQHAIPQGAQAGANAVAAALGRPLGSYRQPLYLTCLDLGSAGALLTTGFQRDRPFATGAKAKAFKRYINRSVIYPPVTGGRRALHRVGTSRPPGPRGAALQRRAVGTAALRTAVVSLGRDRAADHGATEIV
jgi:NADH dehydrogenase